MSFYWQSTLRYKYVCLSIYMCVYIYQWQLTVFPQLEDEALKHIGAHCPELVTLNLQTCSVSTSYGARRCVCMRACRLFHVTIAPHSSPPVFSSRPHPSSVLLFLISYLRNSLSHLVRVPPLHFLSPSCFSPVPPLPDLHGFLEQYLKPFIYSVLKYVNTLSVKVAHWFRSIACVEHRNVFMFSHLTLAVNFKWPPTQTHTHTQKRKQNFLCEQQITDEGLITICRGCHRLQSLCVSGCANITDAILHALGQNCPRLRWVHALHTNPNSALGAWG